MPPIASPPPALLDTLLRLAPLDVLLFDSSLICRYAAPAGDTLLGRTVDQLVGQPASALFPSGADDLKAALKLAAESVSPSRYASYRYAHEDPTAASPNAIATSLFCWSVRVEPIQIDDYRGTQEFRGVLVTLADIRDLADSNERLHEENANLRAALAAARRREATLVASQRRLREAVRNQLAPVSGYLQAIGRRPRALAGHSVDRVIEDRVLPGLRRIVDLVDGAVESAPGESPGSRS